MNDYKFGNYLCELRTSRGLSQAELGRLLGVSDKAVSKWETGAAKPQTSKLLPLSEILGVRVEDLLSGERATPVPEDPDAPSDSRVDFPAYVGIKLREARSRRRLSGVFFLLSVLPLLFALLALVLCEGYGADDTVIGPLSAGLLVLFSPAFLLTGILLSVAAAKICNDLFLLFPERKYELELLILGGKDEIPAGTPDFEIAFTAFRKKCLSSRVTELVALLFVPFLLCAFGVLPAVTDQASDFLMILSFSVLIFPFLLLAILICEVVFLIRQNRAQKRISALFPREMAAYQAKHTAFFRTFRARKAVLFPLVIAIASVGLLLLLAVLTNIALLPLAVWMILSVPTSLLFAASTIVLWLLRGRAERSFDHAWLAGLNQ